MLLSVYIKGNCYTIEIEKGLFYGVKTSENIQGNGLIFKTSKMRFYCVTKIVNQQLFEKGDLSPFFGLNPLN